MRRLPAFATLMALVLLLASPVLADYPLDDPVDPVRALFLYYMAGPEYGRRTVWHPQANLFEAYLFDGVMSIMAQGFEEEYHPSAEDRSKIAGLLEDEFSAQVFVNAEHPGRAIVRFTFPTDDAAEHDPMDFAVAFHGDKWRIFALMSFHDNPDQWAVFSVLDESATDQ